MIRFDRSRRALGRLGARGLLALLLVAVASTASAGGRLLATGGATQVEGSAGSGLVPWAVIAGTGTDEEIGGSAFGTGVFVDDLRLASFGGALGLWDRVELSFAHQRLEVRPLDETIAQNVFGLKVKLAGDLVYGRVPAISVGAQFKHVLDFDVPKAVGADDDWGVDVYAGATKLFLGAVGGHHLLLSGAVRASRANELGLLGFGGPGRDNYDFHFEGAAAIFLTRRVAVGYDFRHKSSDLGAFDEDPWHDVFIALVPSHHFKVVAAWARLGQVAGLGHQGGGYISIQGSF